MPRTAAQNQAIKDKRKKRLLEIALKIFAYQGYAGVTIDDITKAGRCSHGLFYHYFSSKEDVFEEVVKYFILNQTKTPLLTAEEMGQFHGEKGLGKFFEIVEKLQVGPQQDLYTAKILLDFERVSDRSGIRKEAMTLYDIRGTFERLIKEGQEEGNVIAGSPKDIATVFFDLLIGIFECSLSGNQILKKTVSKDLLLSMTLNHSL